MKTSATTCSCITAIVLPALWDLHLLMTNGGRHRTVELFRSLLDRAGFDIERVAELSVETTAIIAARRG